MAHMQQPLLANGGGNSGCIYTASLASYLYDALGTLWTQTDALAASQRWATTSSTA